MTSTEFIADIEQRSQKNGGLPIEVSGEDMHRLQMLAKLKPYRHLTAMFSGNALKPLIKAARKRVTEQVAFQLNPVKWLANDGREFYPQEMGLRHLRNTYLMLKEGRLKRPSVNGLNNAQWLRVFENELVRRGSFAS